MDNIFKESKLWQCIYSLEYLMENNEICMIDREEKRSHSYQGPVIYFKNPRTGDYSIQIGILDDGFYYNRADCEVEDLPKGNTKDLMEELYLYRKYKSRKYSNIGLEKEYECKFQEKIIEDLSTNIHYDSIEWQNACNYYNELLPILKDTIIKTLLSKKTYFLVEIIKSNENSILTWNYLLNRVITTLKVEYGFNIKYIKSDDKKTNIVVEVNFK